MAMQLQGLKGPYIRPRNPNKSNITANVGRENIRIIESYAQKSGFATTSAFIRAAIREYMRNHPVEEQD